MVLPGGYVYQDSIFEFSPVSESWTSVATMRVPRAGHAISVVNFEDFAKYCDFTRSIDVPIRKKQKKRKNRRKNKQKKQEKQA